MTFETDLTDRIRTITLEQWTITAGRVVPDATALPFANHGKTLSACIMYADLSNSTAMVDRASPTLAAEYYKAFLHCASRLIESNQGTIEAYDGDRVMGVFLGDGKEGRAVKAAFQLNRAMATIVNPEFAATYDGHVPLQYTVGIDTGEVMACKAGVRGASELVWVGSPANYAAKLNSFPGLDHAYPTRITEAVLANLVPPFYFIADGSTVWVGPDNSVGFRYYRSWATMDLP